MSVCDQVTCVTVITVIICLYNSGRLQYVTPLLQLVFVSWCSGYYRVHTYEVTCLTVCGRHELHGVFTVCGRNVFTASVTQR